MNKISIMALALIITSSTALAQQVPLGNWSGQLNAGGQQLEMRLHVTKGPNQELKSNWDVPAQKVKGLPSSKTEVLGNELRIELKQINGGYNAIFNDSLIEGSWQQSGMKFKLVLRPFNDSLPEKKLNRPQTPKPPFAYISQDITYKGTLTGLSYGATLTYPSAKKKYPLVILITGSGKQDRDETLFEHKPFAVIADHLTKSGYAVLRVDDRGIGQSNGNFASSTSADFAMDVEEHIRYARTLDMIDGTKIGLCGHSEGGLIAPLVASKDPGIAFLILLAGPGIPINELMTLQNREVLRSQKIPEDAVAAYLPLYKTILNAVAMTTDAKEATATVRNIVRKWLEVTDKKLTLPTTGIQQESDADRFASVMASQLSTAWWRYFISFDPGEYLQKIKIPVLAMNGGADIQVVANENLKGIESSLKKGGNKNYKILKMEGLNHLFQRCKECTVAEYESLETTFEPEVLDEMVKFLSTAIVKGHQTK